MKKIGKHLANLFKRKEQKTKIKLIVCKRADVKQLKK
jgi:hypothetical protein